MSMSDRELLELAAKALDDPKLFANNTGAPWQYWIGFCEEMQCDVTRLWNPLEDDGDALRLAARLEIGLHWCISGRIYAHMHGGVETCESSREDRESSLRRAIVRAAAEIGKSMQESK